MSNEKQETIADIVADIRAQNQGLPEDDYALSPLVADLLSFADRIEAAWKREREAGAEAAQICYEIGEMIGRESTREKFSQVGNTNAMRDELDVAEQEGGKMRKYELTKEKKTLADGTVLHRIRALRDISLYGVKAGDLGGLIEKENNLSQYGDAWVFGDAKVFGNAWVFDDAKVFGNAWVFDDAKVFGDALVSGNAEVSGNAWVFGNAEVSGDAKVYGDAKIYGDAKVSGNADYMVVKNTWSSGRWFTYTRSNKKWAVGCFYDTGEELIAKAYNDSELSGKCYEAIVRAVETIEAAKAEAKGESNGSK